MLALSVTEPCHEKWAEMTPVEQGVYCGACSKHVIDFTAMANKDILDYFQKRKDQAVCGRFRNDQLNRPLIEISPSVFNMDIPLWKKFLAVLFICFSSLITGCSYSDSAKMDYAGLEVPVVLNPPVKPAEILHESKRDSAIDITPPLPGRVVSSDTIENFIHITLGLASPTITEVMPICPSDIFAPSKDDKPLLRDKFGQ